MPTTVGVMEGCAWAASARSSVREGTACAVAAQGVCCRGAPSERANVFFNTIWTGVQRVHFFAGLSLVGGVVRVELLTLCVCDSTKLADE
jgi:hypothetical protein